MKMVRMHRDVPERGAVQGGVSLVLQLDANGISIVSL